MVIEKSKTFDIDPIIMRPNGVFQNKVMCCVFPIDREASKFTSVLFAFAVKSGNANDKSGGEWRPANNSEIMKMRERKEATNVEELREEKLKCEDNEREGEKKRI